MWTSMNNSTLLLENDGPLNSPGFMAYSILLAVIALVAGTMMGLTILALLKSTSVPGMLRLFLVNLLFAGLVVAGAMIFMVGTATVLISVSSSDPRPRYLCRAYLWAFCSGVVARLWSLSAFSMSILAIVRFSKKTISKRIAAGIILTLWLVPMILSLYILLPFVFEAQFVHNVACFPDNNRTIIVEAHSAFLAIWTVFGGLLPLTVSIIVPIVCLCYIRRNIVTEGVQYRKGLAKLSLFLVVGNGINFAGQVFPVLFAFNTQALGVYLSYGSIAVSLLPTPIIIMSFLKPAREQAKMIVTCGQCCKRAEELKSSNATLSSNI